MNRCSECERLRRERDELLERLMQAERELQEWHLRAMGAEQRLGSMEARAQERQLRHEAQLDAMTESAERAADKLDPERQ